MTATSTSRGADRLPAKHPRSAKRRSRYNRSDARYAWALLAPAVVLFTIFIVLPTLSVLVLSLFSWHFLDTPQFVGFKNFVELFTDSSVWQSVGVTFEFLLLGVVPTVVLGFMVAVLVNARMRGVGVLRVLYFIPVVLSVSVSAVLWHFLYDPRQGPIADLLRTFGVSFPDVLNSTALATPALVVIMIWSALPIVILLYLAALQRIPQDIYDAASIDGAGSWRTLWTITWPNVVPTTLVVAILQVINFSSGSLDISLVMTGGGPLGATRSLGLYAYQQAFQNQDAGYSATLALLQLALIVALVSIGQLIVRKVNR